MYNSISFTSFTMDALSQDFIFSSLTKDFMDQYSHDK